MTPQARTDLDFLSAMIHGRRSRLAEGDRLDALTRLRAVQELARTLFPDAGLYTAVDLQRRLIEEQAAELRDLAERAGGSGRHLLEWLVVRLAMENLKVLARGLTSGLDAADLRPHLVPLPAGPAPDVEALAEADTLEDFAGLIPYEPLRQGVLLASEVYEARPRPFFLEAGLDHGYLAELLIRAARLPKPARGDVTAIARQEADTFHLMLASRGKFFYELGPEELSVFHVPGAGLTRQAFVAMTEAEPLRDVAARAVGVAIDAMPEGWDREGPDEGHSPAALEALAWERYYRLANRTFRRSHMGLGAVVAYAAIRRVELANLVTLSEGVRAGLRAEVIRRRLIPGTAREAARV